MVDIVSWGDFFFIPHFFKSTKCLASVSASRLVDDEERNVAELAAGAQVLAF